jgi:dimethylargininase
MDNFTKAIVRTPGRSMIAGLSKANLGIPDYARALQQHCNYISALEACGLEVLVLDAEEAFPDSTFVEDTAVLTPDCAIISRPAACSRRGETEGIRLVLERCYAKIEKITAPGTLDGGDVMQVGQHFYIGLSSRTNPAGANQLIAILERYGMSGSTLPVTDFLHLKSGVTCIAEQTLLAAGKFITQPEFCGLRVLPVAGDETYGANCIRINGKILMSAGFPRLRQLLAADGTELVEVDISEYAKLDGGLSCLSLRF